VKVLTMCWKVKGRSRKHSTIKEEGARSRNTHFPRLWRGAYQCGRGKPTSAFLDPTPTEACSESATCSVSAALHIFGGRFILK
jgi:hypothetical protein